MIIHDMFTDFCVVDKLNLNLSSISEYCYNREKNENGNIISNIGGWQSTNIIHDSFDHIENLKYEILDRIEKISNHVGLKENINYSILNMWININRKNNYNLLHDHPGSIFSGTFYVKCSDASGNLFFCSSKEKGWCLPKSNEKFTSYNSQTYEIVPEENNLVIFLSSSSHYVGQNLSDDDRISISFNVGMK